MRTHWVIATAVLLVALAAPASAGGSLQIHFSGLQVIASDPEKRHYTTVDEVWVLAVSDSPSIPEFRRHPHRSYLKLGCDGRGVDCERVILVDGMDLELRLQKPGGVAITPMFRNGVFRFDADLGYGRLDERLLEAREGRRDGRLSSRLRLVGGTLDLDRDQGFCAYTFEPLRGVVSSRLARNFFSGAVFSADLGPRGAAIAFVDRRTEESLGEIDLEDFGETGADSPDDVIHVWYTNEPDSSHAPRDLQHYLMLSVLGAGPRDSARLPLVSGACPVAATLSSSFCPDTQYP